MRMWHKDLIEVLPRQQLLSQWREIAAMVKSIKENGTPNHILVNHIMEYPLSHFICYGQLIYKELKRREYNVDEKLLWNLKSLEPNYKFIDYNLLYSMWHDEVYLRVCIYNLYEKYLGHGINSAEWNRILDKLYELDTRVASELYLNEVEHNTKDFKLNQK